uniref:39S ribosomal protein L23, mitochondrial n=1 Tax=Equus asinus TaxID=9793 RepID=A0A9L0KCP9_EQUAS
GGRSVRRRPGGGQVRLRCWGGAVGVGADQVAVRCGSGTQGGAVGVRCRPGGCQVGVRCGQVQAGRGPARVLPGARGRCARGRAGRACPSFRPRPRKRRWRGTCCSNRKRDHRNVRIKKPDYKVAYVQLAHGQTFTFPDLFPEKKQSEGSTAVDEDIQDKFLEEQRERQRHDPRRGGVPNWFGL